MVVNQDVQAVPDVQDAHLNAPIAVQALVLIHVVTHVAVHVAVVQDAVVHVSVDVLELAKNHVPVDAPNHAKTLVWAHA